MAKAHGAAERLSFEETLARLASNEAHARSVLARLETIAHVEPGCSILDIGAAQGRFAVACAKMGYRAFGVEPWADAIEIAGRLAAHENVDIHLVRGVAEDLPFESDYFDVVHAMSVIEHVQDAQASFNEAFRVLKPGGVFWFYTASSMCPRQPEISGFPLFGWYPNPLKLRIMKWATEKKPHLVGNTEMPAVNWFTPWKARRMLRAAGFREILSRWTLPRPSGESPVKRSLVGLAGSCFLTEWMADVLVPCCAYAAIK